MKEESYALFDSILLNLKDQMLSYELNENKIQNNLYSTFIFSIETVSLWEILKRNNSKDSKCYFKSKDDKLEVLGLGELLSYTCLDEVLTFIKNIQLDSYLLGGVDFNETSKSIPSSKNSKNYFFLPKLTVVRKEKKYKVIFNVLNKDLKSTDNINTYLNSLEILFLSKVYCQDLTLKHIRSEHSPTKDVWSKQVNQALSSIQQNGFEKIVLSRKIIQEFNQDFSILNYISPMQGSYCFYIRRKNQVDEFLSLSPEKLYRTLQSNIDIDIIAGTRPRGTSEIEDNLLQDELLSCDKELSEHRHVQKEVLKNLEILCKNSKFDFKETILKLPHVQHIYTKASGVLKNNYKNIELIKTIHPTPAVGGLPKEKAIEKINQIEQFQRGLFAGPVGVMSKNYSEFCVAIRSLRKINNKVEIFAGAGIVSGSCPEKEWNETSVKMKNFSHLEQIGKNEQFIN